MRTARLTWRLFLALLSLTAIAIISGRVAAGNRAESDTIAVFVCLAIGAYNIARVIRTVEDR